MSIAHPTFTPAFAGYVERVRSSFARQGAMKLIGAQMLAVALHRGYAL